MSERDRTGRFAPGGGLDHDGVHLLLWLRRDARGTCRVRQKSLAAELGVTKYVMCRTLAAMVTEGRMTRMNRAAGSASPLYQVVDPEEWDG